MMKMETLEGMAFSKNLNFNICMQCGRCSGICPLFSKSHLNPRKLMLEIAYTTTSIRTYPPLNIYERSDIWDCTTCSTCSSYCPRDAKPLDVVIELRSIFIERGNIPRTLADVLEAVYKYGNPWGLNPAKRTDWAQGLDVKYASSQNRNNLLYFVGCAASYDTRAQEIAKAMVKNLNTLGVNFSILGNEEKCCGNEVYSLGEKGLFEDLKTYNLNLFTKYNVQEVIVTSPHCYNALKNKYNLKDEPSVKHYTQYFAELIDIGKLEFSKKIEKVVTYQDPCFLGKHNNIYDEPRRIIENIPGVTFKEFNKSRRQSVCCEGGGGRMWYDIPGGRLAENRVKDAAEMGVEIVAVACPFCLLTIEDAIKTTGNEGRIQVKDITELISEAL
ncbi:MAG: (Fe-S)-binding protein [Candidatus Bathyarchaeia archaeon]